MSLVAVGSGVNNHILTAQGSPHLTPPASTTHSQLRRALQPRGDLHPICHRQHPAHQQPSVATNRCYTAMVPPMPSISKDIHRVATTVLGGTPHAYFRQNESHWNVLEAHISHPRSADPSKAGLEIFLRDRNTLIALPDADSPELTTFRPRLRRQRIVDRLLKRLHGGLRRYGSRS